MGEKKTCLKPPPSYVMYMERPLGNVVGWTQFEMCKKMNAKNQGILRIHTFKRLRFKKCSMDFWTTVDGSEILHQLICSLSHYLQGFTHPRWCRIFPSTVWDTKLICTAQYVKCIRGSQVQALAIRKNNLYKLDFCVLKTLLIDIRAGIELLGSDEKLLHDSNILIYYTLNL